MNINSAFPSAYLRSVDIKGSRPTATIESCELEPVGQGADQKDLPVLRFKGKDSGLVLNRTNANVIIAAFGDETAEWIGRDIEIFVTEVQYKGDVVDGLRVSVPKQDEKKPVVDLDTDVEDEVPF